MSKNAFYFPGQGSQFDDMGIDWCSDYPQARRTYEEAEDLLKLNILKFSSEGVPFHHSTRKSQLAVFTHSIAIWRVLCAQGIAVEPICSGLSLGEFSALVASKRAKFEDLLPLIDQRAQFMEQACQDMASGMVALIGIKIELLQKILRDENCESAVWIANYNTPLQTVISGKDAALFKIAKAVMSAGGRAQRLLVAGAFHSPLMGKAQTQWSALWRLFALKNSPIDFVSSVTGKKEGDLAKLHNAIDKQMMLPVHWSKAAQEVQLAKPTITIEVGAAVLKGMQKRIDGKVDVIAIKSCEDLAQLQSKGK